MVDKLLTNILMPVNGIIVSLLVGWMLSKKASETWLAGGADGLALPKMVWINCCRVVFPLIILYVMISGLWEFLSANL